MNLTPEMIEAIDQVAKRMQATPASVLKRAIFSYAAKYGSPSPMALPEADNVVSLNGAVDNSGGKRG